MLERLSSVNQPDAWQPSSPLDTLIVVQSFCRLMFVVCLAAVPTHLALLMLAVPYDVDFGVKRGLVLLSPIVMFLTAAIIYGVAFLATGQSLPRHRPTGFISLRGRLIRLKLSLLSFGALVFLGGTVWSSVLLVKAHL